MSQVASLAILLCRCSTSKTFLRPELPDGPCGPIGPSQENKVKLNITKNKNFFIILFN